MKTRDQLWLLVFLGFGVNYMLRININIAIVEMVKPTRSSAVTAAECNKRNQSVELPKWRTEAVSSVPNKTQYDWDEYEQNLILSSFYWLHWITQVPGGVLAHYYGSKRVFGLSNFFVALLTFFIPISVSFSFHALVILRLLQGFIAGASWPSMHSMVAKWVPPNERGTFVSAYLGSSVGVAFTYFICGYIIDWCGWEYVFYVTGGLSTIWYLLWVIMAFDTPEEHPWISKEERNFIETSLGDTVNKNTLPIPWRCMVTSPAVWINAVAQWGGVGALFALLTHTPMYLKYIHGFHITSTGVWSGFPHLTRWIFSLAFGIFAQYQTFTSVTNIRKLATALTTIGVAVIIVGLAFSGCSTTMAVTLLIVAITLQGTLPAGPMASIIDMSPNFSSVLQGLTGMLSVTTGFIHPLIVGYLTQHNQTYFQWQKFFFITSAMTFSCGCLYLAFGTSEVQPWNRAKSKDREVQPLHKKANASV